MGISLANILNKATISGTQTDAANAASVSHVAKTLRGAMVLESLQIGQTIRGQVKAMDGSQILLDIGNGVEVNARLENALDIALGKSLMFEVKSHVGDKLSLSPLYTNLSTDGNAAYSALKAAGMPLTENNVAMASAMMKEGMSVDKNSLWQMGKTVAAFPGASAETIVHLKAMGMEINTTNIAGYEAALNMQHKLTDGMNQLSEGLQEIFANLSEQGNMAEGLQLMEETLTLLEGENFSLQVTEKADVPLQETSLQPEILLSEEETSQDVNALKEQPQMQEQSVINSPKDLLDAIQDLKKQWDAFSETTKEPVTESESLKDGQQPILDLAAKEVTPDKESLFDKFQELTKAFEKEFTELLKTNWAMKPEKFADKEDVKEFYKDLQKQLSGMEQILSQHGKENTSAGKTLQNMNQNLQFMENVNQVFPYLQIPLKAAMDNAHGELYVYSRKKGNISEDGSSSALLHLDMQFLGPLDVYVKLKDMNVSTQFTLADEKTLDFIVGHMDLLTQRLESKGYHLDSQVKVSDTKQGEENVIHRIRGMEDGEMLVSYTSFDVRA